MASQLVITQYDLALLARLNLKGKVAFRPTECPISRAKAKPKPKDKPSQVWGVKGRWPTQKNIKILVLNCGLSRLFLMPWTNFLILFGEGHQFQEVGRIDLT